MSRQFIELSAKILSQKEKEIRKTTDIVYRDEHSSEKYDRKDCSSVVY